MSVRAPPAACRCEGVADDVWRSHLRREHVLSEGRLLPRLRLTGLLNSAPSALPVTGSISRSPSGYGPG